MTRMCETCGAQTWDNLFSSCFFALGILILGVGMWKGYACTIQVMWTKHGRTLKSQNCAALKILVKSFCPFLKSCIPQFTDFELGLLELWFLLILLAI